MSTRANIIVRDKFNPEGIQLYRHSDGYPDSEHGVIHQLKMAMPFTWELPRMEADPDEVEGDWGYLGNSNQMETMLNDIIESFGIQEPASPEPIRAERRTVCQG